MPPPGLEYLLRDNQCPQSHIDDSLSRGRCILVNPGDGVGITWSNCPSHVGILLPVPTRAVLPEVFFLIKGAEMSLSTFRRYSFHTVEVSPPQGHHFADLSLSGMASQSLSSGLL